jgi:hypothetical protein
MNMAIRIMLLRARKPGNILWLTRRICIFLLPKLYDILAFRNLPLVFCGNLRVLYMKRILIVDDEYLVRLGLKTIIDWAEHGYIIAGKASNGREAFELFGRIGTDVILTDITNLSYEIDTSKFS